MMLRALIFDVDGTLSETEEGHRGAFNEVFRDEGIGWHWSRDTYRRLLQTTGGKERMRTYRDEVGSGLGDEEIARLHAAKTVRYGEIVRSGGMQLRPGVAALIKRAKRAGLLVAVATTTNRPNVEALIRSAYELTADELFDVIAAGDEVNRKKPAPDVYELALRRLGVHPDEALAFEDSRNGVQAARAAGLRVIATSSTYTDTDDLSDATMILANLSGFDPWAVPNEAKAVAK